MKYVMVFLLVSMGLKDVTILNDRFVLRGVSQSVGILLAFSWISANAHKAKLSSYSIFIFYIMVLLLSLVYATHKIQVFIQVLSLLSVIVIAVAYCESFEEKYEAYLHLFYVIFLTIFTICAGSILYSLVFPLDAYEIDYYGNRRFVGLYPRPSLMGLVAGLLTGLAVFFTRLPFLVRCISFMLPIYPFIWAASRTVWVAFGISAAATIYWYGHFWLKLLVPVVCVGIFTIVMLTDFDIITLFSGVLEQNRPGSVFSLSGRTTMWEEAWRHFVDSPFFGYGYLTGGTIFAVPSSGEDVLQHHSDSQMLGRFSSLHNGYMQALLDSGLFGFLVYVVLILSSITRVIRIDAHREYPALVFCLLFFAMANMGESFIKGGTNFDSTVFWCCAVLAFCLSYGLRQRGSNSSSSLLRRHNRPNLERRKFIL